MAGGVGVEDEAAGGDEPAAFAAAASAWPELDEGGGSSRPAEVVGVMSSFRPARPLLDFDRLLPVIVVVVESPGPP